MQGAIDGRVKVAELSGSESIIHFDAFGDWVSLSHGVHPFQPAKPRFYADMRAASTSTAQAGGR
jgi:glycerol transport system ATP-binding protein